MYCQGSSRWQFSLTTSGEHVQQTCNWFHTLPTAGWVLVNTQSIHLWLWMRVLCSWREREWIYRDNKLRGQTGYTPCQPVLIHLFKSYADSSINSDPANGYCVLCKTFWGNVTNRSSHFRDTIPASPCYFPISCRSKVTFKAPAAVAFPVPDQIQWNYHTKNGANILKYVFIT